MKTTRQVSELKTKKTDFPPWSISDILLYIILSYLVLYTLTSLFKALVLKDMSLEFYGSLETMDKVVILGLEAIIVAFYSSLFFWSIILLRRHKLRLSDIGFNQFISKRWIINSVIGGIISGHLVYFAIFYFLGPLKSWQTIGPFSGKLFLSILPVCLSRTLYGSTIEEIFFRGMSYTAFRKVCGVKWGIFLSSILFTLYHVQNIIQEPTSSIFLLFFGLVFCLVYEKSKSLLPAIILHAIINVTTLLFSYNIHPFSHELHHVIHQLFYF